MHNNEIMSLFSEILAFFDAFLPIFFWIFVIYGFDDKADANLTIIAALIHESGHFLFYYIKGKHLKRLRGTTGGLRIRKDSCLSYKDELLLCLLGPLANLTAAGIGLCFFLFQTNEYFLLFSVINALTAVSNLLPIDGYDGYRVIHSALSILSAGEFLFTMLRYLSLTLVISLCFLSLYLMLKLNGGYWFYAVFIVLLYENAKRTLKSLFTSFKEI